MVQALAFAELVLGGLFIASALTGESLGQLLTQGLTQSGREAAHGKGMGEAAPEPSGTQLGKGVFQHDKPSGLAEGALKIAEKYIGTPYKWGGTNEREGFDCSGLVQSVYAQMGVKLPRTAQEQYNATAKVTSGIKGWQPGDLMFFGNGHEITHVGLYLSPGVMLDAPHKGARVRTENAPTRIGGAWGNDTLMSVNRP